MLRNRLREFRELHGLTGDELSERTAITRQVLTNIETQPGYMPMMATALRLCLYFRVDIGRMFWIDWADTNTAPVTLLEEVPA